jgi:hypothetical protein
VAGRIRYFDVGRVRDKIALFVTSACIQQAFKNRRGFAFSPVFAVQRQSADDSAITPNRSRFASSHGGGRARENRFLGALVMGSQKCLLRPTSGLSDNNQRQTPQAGRRAVINQS